MWSLTLRFWLAAFVVLVVSRLGLVMWQWPRVDAVDGLWPVLLGGLRFDLVIILMMSAPIAVLSPWLGRFRAANRFSAVWYGIALVLLVLMEASTPTFILEYDTRPNRLFVEYLEHPREVASMLWQGFGASVAVILALVAVAALLARRLFRPPAPDAGLPWWQAGLASFVLLAFVVLGIRGTLDHRPINPATVAFSNDAMVNVLPLPSFYHVTYAMYRMKDERSSSAIYGSLPRNDIIDTVRSAAGLSGTSPVPAVPTWHSQAMVPNAGWQPRRVVIIVEESLGAQFVGHLGGAALTPELDAIANDAWTFTQAYATGTRSARGLEAIVTGFLPTPAPAVLKLPRAQQNFFTLAALLGQHDFHSRFVYGGEAHFDNMSSFFLANGFDEVVDRDKFVDPVFVGSWGASDEDMLTQVDRLLRQDQADGAATLTVAFSVSHHTPWDYPAGRIATEGDPATQANAIRYADWALGDFFRRARQAPYWDDTLFVVVADHDARVGGASLIPVKHFRIPALMLGAGIPARQDHRLVSQIDLAPTLLSLLGIDTSHPMLGQDLTLPHTGGRAMMQYGDNFGFLTPGNLTVLSPGHEPRQFEVMADQSLEPAPSAGELAHLARAHALWPEMAYRDQQYRLLTPEETALVRAAAGAPPSDDSALQLAAGRPALP